MNKRIGSRDRLGHFHAAQSAKKVGCHRAEREKTKSAVSDAERTKELAIKQGEHGGMISNLQQAYTELEARVAALEARYLTNQHPHYEPPTEEMLALVAERYGAAEWEVQHHQQMEAGGPEPADIEPLTNEHPSGAPMQRDSHPAYDMELSDCPTCGKRWVRPAPGAPWGECPWCHDRKWIWTGALWKCKMCGATLSPLQTPKKGAEGPR